MQKLLPLVWLAFGGAAGTLARVGLSTLIQRWHGSPWPWGTLVVNALGCLLFGSVWGVISQRYAVPPVWSLALLGGFCGGFTTFSTFAFETYRLTDGRSLGPALAYLLISNVVSVAMIWVGIDRVARWWPGGVGPT